MVHALVLRDLHLSVASSETLNSKARAFHPLQNSQSEAIKMGGEVPPIIDTEALLNAFPHNFMSKD